MGKVKPYRVDFKFMIEETASMYVVAETPEAAQEGCIQMLQQNEQQYQSPEIVKVEEYKKPDETPAPVLN